MSQLIVRPVDLDRTFIPIQPDEPISPDAIEWQWFGLRSGLTWPDLLSRPRVVILAEASSGKTFEFEHRVQRLRTERKHAFFAPIEQLAEADLDVVLGMENWAAFEAWQSSGQPAWFFLDSVDEAKLTRRNFELALGRFAKSLKGGYPRAHILVSCRGTDWDGAADLRRVTKALPVVPMTDLTRVDPEEALLGRVSRKKSLPTEDATPPFTVVSMSALSPADRRKFLVEGLQLADVAGFEAALGQTGLLALAGRPGDLLVLAEHWASHGRLDSLTEMMSVTVDARIGERPHRPDAKKLSLKRAREGAERIAAAMVLGRSMTVTIGAPAAGELGLTAILQDWSPEDQQTLIRRGVFAAASYGKARFNHRSLMEYMAARWFLRLLSQGCPISRLMAVFTARPFGVATVPPSLRATAAWLAPHCPPLRAFILQHAPLTLILHGDPKALAVDDRAALLYRYAELHRRGRIRQDYSDEHALWMFADPGLATVIKAVWSDADDNFRFELLRLVEQGGLIACSKLAISAALDGKAGPYTRIIAVRVLAQFKKTAAMTRLAKQMLDAPDQFDARLGPQLAVILFPKALSLKGLLTLIDRSPRARRYQVEGFGYVLEALYAACPTPTLKIAFIDGVAALCRQAPIRDAWEPVSKRHAPLARRAEALLAAVLKDVAWLGIWPGLVDLLWVAEAADLDSERDRREVILAAIRAHVALNEALFWRGVELMVEREPGLNPVHLWKWQRLERRYWTLREPDRPWLERAAKGMDDDQSRIAFAALISLAEESPESAKALADLRRRYAGNAKLISDLDSYLAPRPDPPEFVEHHARQAARAVAIAKAETLNHQAWRELREEVVGNPDRLKDESRFHAWPNFKPLVSLTNWLASGAERDPLKAVLTYRDLERAFSPAVAEAYAAGMVRFWRVATPKGVKRQSDGQTTRPWSVIVAMAGLALDAATTPDWIGTINLNLARRAARHAFLSAMDLPDWLDALLQAYPQAVEPFVIKGLQQEWAKPMPAFTPLLYRAGANLPITSGVQRALLRLIERAIEPDSERLDQIRKILPRLTLTSTKRRVLATDTRVHIQAAQAVGDWDGAVGRVPILFVLDPRSAVVVLRDLLATQPEPERQARAEGAMGSLFGMARGRVWGLRDLPEDLLADLLRLAYLYIRPENDGHHAGHNGYNGRDEAETARNELLGALMNKPGERAYLLMRQLLAEDAFGVSTSRLHRLAQQMAETASEGGTWDAASVLRFEEDHIEPVTTGERLFALVCELVEDIDNGLRGEDVSARELLLTAKDEHAVQSWLASELKKLAQGRFTVPIEAEAPARDRLDITVIANGGMAEVAIEMKHGGMAWTLPQLTGSLSNQLAKRYLKSKTRRHGVFVVSNHRPRCWKDEGGSQIGFDKLIRRLQAAAERLTANSSGPIHVAVRGVDAVVPGEGAKAERGSLGKGGRSALPAQARKHVGIDRTR